MPTKIDETGNRYGRLLVLKEMPRKEGEYPVRWRCRCDCGKETVVYGTSLRNGNTRSCGCLHKELTRRALKKDEQGNRYGRWLVLEEEPQSPNKPTHWRCRCDCGTEKVVYGYQLRNGESTSCGCLRSERRRNTKIDETGNRYGKLLVLKEAPRGPDRRLRWLCLCDCGTEKAISGSALRRGYYKSCGCAQKGIDPNWQMPKSAREKISRTHTIDEMGKKYSHLLVVKKSPNRLNGLVCWRCHCDCGKYVTVTGDALRKGRATSCGCRKKKKRLTK